MVIVNSSFVATPAREYHEIIRSESIIPYFQPIVSIKEKRVVGFEALLRGIHPITSEIVPPYPILRYARENNLSCDLQRIVCEKSVAAFSQFRQQSSAVRDCFLNLNVDTYLIEAKYCSLGCLWDALEECDIPYSNIVLEIVESSITNISIFERFCAMIREKGFLIALDDFGKGHSNLNRVVSLRPDIIKLDKFLIKGIQKEYYKQEVVKSLIGLSHKTGALVIAEGIEHEDEASPTLRLSADMLQGFYFAKPAPFEEISMEQINKQLKYLEWVYKKTIQNRVNHKRDIFRSYDTIISHMINDLSSCDVEQFERIVRERIGRHHHFECMYVLDERGRQVTNTICPIQRPLYSKSILFNPAPKDADQSNKEYFHFMEMGLEKFITDPYVSMASGNLCITISVSFWNADQKYILCIDTIPDFLIS